MGKTQGNAKRVTVAEIGDRLREAREKKGVTIEQAQKHTHIHSTVLSALEDGRCDDILTPNYVKSFLKEYSGYLGFDHQAIVNEYLAIHPELKTKNINLGIGADQKASADLSRIIRITRSVIIFFIFIFLAVFISSKTGAFFKNLKAVKNPKTSKYSKTAHRAASPAAATRNLPSGKPAPFTMTLKVKNPVMVQLKKDGVLIFKRVLPKGIEETFSANSSINMFVARAEAVEIIINGKSLGSPGRGVIRDVEVTSNGVRAR